MAVVGKVRPAVRVSESGMCSVYDLGGAKGEWFYVRTLPLLSHWRCSLQLGLSRLQGLRRMVGELRRNETGVESCWRQGR